MLKIDRQLYYKIIVVIDQDIVAHAQSDIIDVIENVSAFADEDDFSRSVERGLRACVVMAKDALKISRITC